jgi:Ca2+-binding RTX toxin-like protein
MDEADNLEFISLNPGSTTAAMMDGQKGVDALAGGPNDDFLDGGVGDASKDTIYGRAGRDLIAGGPGDDLLSGEADDDLMFGEAGKDTMRGGSGNDDLFGGTENDTMFGDSDDDNLFGGAGGDTLNGETGLDYLFGGLNDGKDTLVGGDHADRFRPDGTAANNKDKPRDYRPQEGDRYVTSVTSGFLRANPNVSWLALDSAFQELGGRESYRPRRRVA